MYYYRDKYVQQTVPEAQGVNDTSPSAVSAGAFSGQIRGLIAQEVQAVCPECVTTRYRLPGDSTEYLALDKMRLMADMIAVIQNLLERVETLEAALSS
jgi:hypothetical protein